MGLADDEQRPSLTIVVPPALRPLLVSRRRADAVTVRDDGVSTIGHLVGSLRIPLTEVEQLLVAGVAVPASWRPGPGVVVELIPRSRPQQAPTDPPRFALDVHLGTLARRLRLLGLDVAWRNDATDDELIRCAREQRRVLLTRDIALLLRRAARVGAYVRGTRPDDQLLDVLDRFEPPLKPWSRCLACNGVLIPVQKEEIADRLPPGTRRTYRSFVHCQGCRHIYWPGAHHAVLQRIVESALLASGRNSC
jgi:uncharacterized protein with PIN domain